MQYFRCIYVDSINKILQHLWMLLMPVTCWKYAESVVLYCCKGWPSCLAHLNCIGWETKVIWAAIKEYCLCSLLPGYSPRTMGCLSSLYHQQYTIRCCPNSGPLQCGWNNAKMVKRLCCCNFRVAQIWILHCILKIPVYSLQSSFLEWCKKLTVKNCIQHNVSTSSKCNFVLWTVPLTVLSVTVWPWTQGVQYVCVCIVLFLLL